MKKFIKGAFFVVCLLFTAMQVNAQKLPFKIGEITDADFQLTGTEVDTSASAIVLYDYGTSYFSMNGSGLILNFERHIRIKIMKQDGYEQADVEVPAYRNASEREYVNNIRGYTHNLIDGKIVTDKLDKKGVFEEKTSDNWMTTKFTLPNVKVGAIIEYTYKTTSPFFFNFQPWYFQHDIPVKWSEYFVSIPDFYSYQKVYQGYTPFTINESGDANLVINSQTYHETTNRWVQENVPAFRKEKHITTSKDYISKIEFQLSTINMPGQPVKDIMGTWPTMLDLFLKDEKFGKQLDLTRPVVAAVASLVEGKTTELEKTKAIYDYVAKQIKWNGKHSIYATKTMKDVMDTKEGNSAEVNVLFIGMLRTAGIEATPVRISTRSHGRVSQIYPLLSKFNHVITLAKADGQEQLMDPTDPMRPHHLLADDDINGVGLLVQRENAPQWVELNKMAKRAAVVQLTLNLDEEGLLSGEAMLNQDGYEGVMGKEKAKKDGNDAYIAEVFSKFGTDISTTDITMEGHDDAYMPLKSKCAVKFEGLVDVAGDRMYFNPMLGFQTKEVPFKDANRLYPIDYGYTSQQVYALSLTLPEGYVVEEMPKTVMFALPNKGGKFTYSVSLLGKVLTVSYRLVLSETSYPAENYAVVKEFFTQIVAKEAEQVVLKKANANE